MTNASGDMDAAIEVMPSPAGIKLPPALLSGSPLRITMICERAKVTLHPPFKARWGSNHHFAGQWL